VFYPIIRLLFRLNINGRENLVRKKTLYISNHNIGALIESHTLLFELDKIFGDTHIVYGFTHPSIFKIPGLCRYFLWLGSVPSTYETAKEIFQENHSVLIFPGGNKQALRSIWDYKKNSFRESHGWAKIAKENQVDIVPITFKGSHFVNPVLWQSGILAKLLIFPWLVGLKWISVSVSQILLTFCTIYFLSQASFSIWIIVILSIIVFSLTSLVLIFPAKITLNFHPRISSELPIDEIEDRVDLIMSKIYSKI
jgi:1-acyl-sn-glycerol-3-phosphate acyltransferase